jgi:hypothetical protein
MANVSLEKKLTLDNTAGIAPAQFDVNELNVQGLPSLLYWVRAAQESRRCFDASPG